MGKKVNVYFLQTRGSPKRISLVRLRFDTLGPVLYRCLQDIEVPIKATLLLHIKKIALSLG